MRERNLEIHDDERKSSILFTMEVSLVTSPARTIRWLLRGR